MDAGGDKSLLKYSAAAAESNEPTEASNMEEEASSEVKVGSCEVTDEGDKITDRRLKRRRWWRRFFLVVICFRRQTKDEKSSAKQQSHKSPPPEGVLQQVDAVLLNNMNTEENTDTKGKKTAFKSFLTSSNIRRNPEQTREEKPSLTFRKQLQMFLTRRRRSRLSLENMEDMRMSEEAPHLSVTQVEEPADLQNGVTDWSPEAVMVTAEMNVQLSEETTGSDESPTEDVMEEEARGAAKESEFIQTDSVSVVTVVANTNEVPVDVVFSLTTKVTSETDDHLSSEEASEVPAETNVQPTTNGPATLLYSSIRIQLIPPDNITEEEEGEECWEVSFSSENQNHLLLGLHHTERQLLQTARSVVRAAMNAAMDQLSREQPSVSDCVHREPQGCRDHA
ncbi:hypothetical protein PAMP_014656 [Pampus punctatissimus]